MKKRKGKLPHVNIFPRLSIFVDVRAPGKRVGKQMIHDGQTWETAYRECETAIDATEKNRVVYMVGEVLKGKAGSIVVVGRAGK